MSPAGPSGEDGPGAVLDRLDRRIVELLQVDGRASFASIAGELGVTEEEVSERIASLVSHRVIEVVAVTDPLQLGYPRQAMLGVITEGPSRPVGEQIARIEEVIYQARTEGDFDLMVEVVGTSDAHLLELVARIRRLPGVQRIHTFLYQELVKETYAYGVGADTALGEAGAPEGIR